MPRRKETDNVRELRGTARPDRNTGPTLEFDEVTQAPAAPQYLNIHARSYWERIVPVLLEKRVLSIADLEALEVMCTLYGKIRKAAEAEVDLNAAAVTQLRMYQTEFGLTPASRAKIKAGDDGGKGNKFANRGKAKA